MKRLQRYCWLIPMILMSYGSYAQTELENLEKRAFEAKSRHDYDSAIYFKEQIEEILLSDGDSVGYLTNKISIGVFLANKGSFDEGVSILNHALQEAKSLRGGNCVFEAYSALSSIYAYRNRLSEAERYLLLAGSNFRPTEAKEPAAKMGKLYFDKGNLDHRQQKILRAKSNFEQALRIYDSLNYNNPFHAEILYSLAGTNNSMGLFTEAREQIKRSIHMTQIFFKDSDHPSLILKYFGLADILSSQNLGHEAIEYLSRAMRISLQSAPNDPYTDFLRTRLSRLYLNIDNVTKSLELKNENLKERIKRFGANSIKVAESFYELGNQFSYQKDFNRAVESFKKSERIYEKLAQGGKNHNYVKIYLGINLLLSGKEEEGQKLILETLPMLVGKIATEKYQLVVLYMNLANAHLVLADHDAALEYYQKAITTNLADYDDLSPHKNPAVGSITDSRELLPAFIGKAKSLEGRYQRTGSEIDLKSALSTVISADSLTNMLKTEPKVFSDKASFQSLVSEANVVGIRLCHDMYDLTGERMYLDQAFRFSEKNKYNLILSSLEEMLFLKQSIISDSLVESLQNSVTRIAFTESRLYQQEQVVQKDSVLKAFYESELTRYREEQRALLEELESTYPKYYEVKHRQYLSDIASIQNSLDSTELLISYHLTDQELNSFEISKYGVNWVVKPLDSVFYEKVQSYVTLLNNPGKGIDKFRKISSELRRTLLPQKEILSRFESLVIIPDNLLGQIPFGTLIDPDDKAVRFNELDYLINTHSVKYANSVSLLKRQRSDMRHFRSSKVLAFAPSFDETAQSKESDSIRNNLGVLSWTEDEVKAIDRHFNTKALIGKTATEKSFREWSSEYGIIHIASHGVLNEENPLFSTLVFSPHDMDSINDGFLNTQEIFNMEIPANMVVLSACNSGVGEVVNGEGAVSLANSFFYAGARSLVMTLWTANDESSALIMDKFYMNLAGGQTKSQALRNAKLEYLETADGLLSHPYYWAHFVVNGDDQPLVKSGRQYYWFAILIGLILALFFIVRKRHSLSNSHLD